MNRKQSKLSVLVFNQTPMTGKIAAVYVRVSSNDMARYRGADKEKQFRKSVTTQTDDGTSEATRNNWAYEVFRGDCNISGFETDDRPDIQRIIEGIKAGKIHTLICRDPKRLTRNAHFGSQLLHEVFLPYGVNLVCYDCPVNIASPEGQDAFLQACSKGQQELQYISKVSRRNREALVSEGGFSGKPPYGFRMKGRAKNVVEQVPDQVEIVQELFRRYDSGEGLPTIVRDFSRRGVKRIVAGDADWGVSDVARMLRKRQYIGEVLYNGKPYPAPYTPIVSQEVFERVQAQLEKNGHRGHRAKNSPHLLTEILKCGNCHDILAIGKKERIKRWANLGFVNGMQGKYGQFQYYRCQTSVRYPGMCISPGKINARTVEDFVRAYVAELCVLGLPMKSTRDKQDILDRIAVIEKQIAKLESKKAGAIRTFTRMDKEMPEDLMQILAELNARIAEQETDERQAKALLAAINDDDPAATIDLLKRWDTLPMPEKRAALRAVVDKMLVYRDRLVVFMGARPTQPIEFPITKVGKGFAIQDPHELTSKWLLEFGSYAMPTWDGKVFGVAGIISGEEVVAARRSIPPTTPPPNPLPQSDKQTPP